MSDNSQCRSFMGNSAGGPGQGAGALCHRESRRRLVEETQVLTIRAVRKAVGKPAILTAIRQACPLRLRVFGREFELYFVEEMHRLPGRLTRYSSNESGDVRVWLQCPYCLRTVANLHCFVYPGTSEVSELACRRCHRLQYMSVNCGKSRWYKVFGRQIKRLARERDKLLSRRPTPGTIARLREIDTQIEALARKGRTKVLRSGGRTRERRPYRNVALLM